MNRLVFTILGKSISAEQLSAVIASIAGTGLSVERTERLFPPACLAGTSSPHYYSCVRVRTAGQAVDAEAMRISLLELARTTDLDIVFESEATYGRQRRLIALDMDSTLIHVEVIDEMAKLAGVGEHVSRITESAMRGELDFKQSFTKRLSLLRGLPEAEVRALVESIPLTDGAESLISCAKKLGLKTAILSGGFTFVGRRMQSRLGIDYLFANELEIVEGFVSGRVIGPILDAQRKKGMLEAIALKEGIPLEQVVAVGDGANDLPMLNISGMGIAFHAKPIVRQSAKFAISALGLDAILYFLSPGAVQPE